MVVVVGHNVMGGLGRRDGWCEVVTALSFSFFFFSLWIELVVLWSGKMRVTETEYEKK